MESQGWQKVVAFPWVCVLDGLQACYTWDSAPITRWTRWKLQTHVKKLLWPEGLPGKTAVASKCSPSLHGPLGPPDHQQHLQQSYTLNMWDSQQRAEVWIRVCWNHHLMIPWCPWRLPVQWETKLFAVNEWEIVASVRGGLCDLCSVLFLVLWKKKKTSLRKATSRRKVY